MVMVAVVVAHQGSCHSMVLSEEVKTMNLVVGDRVRYVIRKQESLPAAHTVGMAFVHDILKLKPSCT